MLLLFLHCILIPDNSSFSFLINFITGRNVGIPITHGQFWDALDRAKLHAQWGIFGDFWPLKHQQLRILQTYSPHRNESLT